MIEVAGDEDWFQVQLTGGQNYLVSQTGRNTQLEHTGYTLGHPYIIGIYNSQGEELQGSRYYPYDSWHTFTPEQTGAYYILVAAVNSFRPTGTYVVSVQQLPADDIASDTTTSSSLAVGGSASGVIGTLQDVDWHRAQLTGGTEYVLDIDAHYGGNRGVCDGDDSVISPGRPYYGHRHCLLGWELTSNVFFEGVYDSGGSAVSDGVTFGDTPHRVVPTPAAPYRLTFTPATTGTYYIATKTKFTYYETLGEYTVSLRESADVTPDDFPADASTTAVVTASQSLEGRIDHIQDADYVKVSLKPGNRYTFDVRPDRDIRLEKIPGTENTYRFVEQPGSGRHLVELAGRLYTSDGKKFYGRSRLWHTTLDYCYEVTTAEEFFLEVKGRYFGIGGYEVRMFEYAGESCD